VVEAKNDPRLEAVVTVDGMGEKIVLESELAMGFFSER